MRPSIGTAPRNQSMLRRLSPRGALHPFLVGGGAAAALRRLAICRRPALDRCAWYGSCCASPTRAAFTSVVRRPVKNVLGVSMKHSSGASALAGNAAKAAPHVTGEVYGRLINLSGRRRFTSQRVALFAVLASQGRTEALQASRSALATFMEAHTALMEGNADL